MRINVNQFTLASRWENALFFLRRGSGNLFRFLMNRFRWHYYPRLGYVSKFPDHVDIESTNLCNMTCPMCYRHGNEWDQQLMNWNLYKKIVDECAKNKCYSIRLSWRGEPMLHPKVVDMICYAKQKGIKEISLISNGLGLTEETSRELIKSGLDWLTISFDGLGETYEKIRKPAKFDEAVHRLQTLQDLKKKLGSKKPVLKIQSIWTAIKHDPQAFYEKMSPVVDLVSSISNKDYYTGEIDHDPDFVCPTLWQRLVITCTGDVVQCICDNDERLHLGNVRTQRIKEIWHSPKFNNVRKLHKQKERLNLKACQQCYDGNRKDKNVIKIGNRKVIADFQSTTYNLPTFGVKRVVDKQKNAKQIEILETAGTPS